MAFWPLLVFTFVGYGSKQSATAKYTGVGSFFFNLGATEDIDLTDLKVECIGGDGYLDPDLEYLRELNPASAGDMNRYTYINEAFIKDATGDSVLSEDQLKMVGWWIRPANDSIWDLVCDNTLDYLVKKGDKVFNPRQAFLGQFRGTGIGGPSCKITCSGEVLCDTTEIQTKTAKYVYFHNYTPSPVMLTDLEIECEGGDGYLDPDLEYMRELNPASAGDMNRYTYINEAFIKDATGDSVLSADQLKMVGWWIRPNDDSIWDLVCDNVLDYLVDDKTDIELASGFALLGQFRGTGIGGPNCHIKFPNPVKPVK